MEEDNMNTNETPETQGNKERQDKKKKKTIIAIITAIVIVILLLLCLKSCGGSPGTDQPVAPTFDLTEDSNASDGGLEGKSQEEIEAELNKKVADGMINISMNMNPVFETGTSEGNLLIVNEDVNTYPQVVEIYLDDTNELVYRSGGIPVGSKVETGTLLVDLDKGTYPCTAYFNSVNPKTNELLGKAGAQIEITVNG